MSILKWMGHEAPIELSSDAYEAFIDDGMRASDSKY